MPLRRRKNFILIAEIAPKRVHRIIEGPSERDLTADQIQDVDALFHQRHGKLVSEFPATVYDTICTRASDREELVKDYPEFSGWEQVKVEMIQ